MKIVRTVSELRAELEAAGQEFSTETDTETVAQLLDYLLQQGLSPDEAIQKAFSRLQGAYALAVIFAGHNNLLIGAQHGAPLAVGYGDGAMYLGSDALALAPLTRRIAYLRDGDWAILSRTEASFRTLDGTAIQRPIQHSAFTGAAIGKGYRPAAPH